MCRSVICKTCSVAGDNRKLIKNFSFSSSIFLCFLSGFKWYMFVPFCHCIKCKHSGLFPWATEVVILQTDALVCLSLLRSVFCETGNKGSYRWLYTSSVIEIFFFREQKTHHIFCWFCFAFLLVTDFLILFKLGF